MRGMPKTRYFQGWLSIDTFGPGEGMIRVLPLLKHATAYFMLRPLFDSSNKISDDTVFQGAIPARGQEFNATMHPHLDLPHSLISPPTVHPGDCFFFHCDTIHAVDPVHQGKGDSSVMYIGVAPLTPNNAEYLKLQRDSFLSGVPAPDFPGGIGESKHVGRATPEYIAEIGGKAALQAMGLAAFDISEDMDIGEKNAIEEANEILGF